MRPELSAVLVSAGTTAAVASAGAFGLWRLAFGRPAAAARAAPAVVVAALAAGVAVATRAMVVAEDDYRTVLFVLAAGAPLAALIGVLLARRVSAMEEHAARERADRLRAEQVEESRRELIGWLSHDLRTPLAGVRALAESLQENVIDDPTSTGERIVREVDRLNAMVDDIAELSRMHGMHDLAGGPVRPRERVRVDDLVSDAVESVMPLADAAGDVSAVDPQAARDRVAATSAAGAAPSPAASAMPAGAYLAQADYDKDAASRAGTKVVYFFHASWCPDCRATEASLTADGVPAGLTVVKVDYDTATDLRKTYGITQQHTFVQIGPDGAQLAKWTGTKTGEAIKAKTL